jgi:hypothetical protein
MIKKFISMATATILLATGISVLGASTASANSNANLSSLGYREGNSVTSVPSFSANTTSYTISTSTNQLQFFSSTSESNRPKARTCNGQAMGNDDNNYCVFVSGTNTYTVTVTAPDLTTTKTYTVTINYTPPAGPAITSTSTITAGQVNPTIVIASSMNFASTNVNAYTFNLGTTGLTVGTLSGSGTRTLTIQLTGTASAGTLTFLIPSFFTSPASNTLSFVVAAGSSPAPSTTLTAAEIAANAAAAAKAAAEAAAAVRAAEVAVAQTKLSTVLRGDKAGTIDEYKAANIAISTAASLARINAEVLKLSANDRSDFIKIKAIADKIEFDESFFNATARPTLATYVKYEVVGITERILPTVNTKVLELPAAKRTDAAAIKEIVKVESFVDVVANTTTRESVTSTRLIEKGLLPADTPYKHSVRSGLASYPEGSLNSMAKIEAAIKAELEKAGARKAKTAEIRARIAARNK